MPLTKKILVLILLLQGIRLFAQGAQGVNQMQNNSEVHNAFFPFGQPLKLVKQQDKSPKKVFVLGVYASAVHAEWYSAEGNLLCQALAVASEPEIFWKGENAADIISKITVPPEAGYLKPAAENNGPSGKVLDELYLTPLEFSRSDAWLCDLVPHSLRDEEQNNAIENYYNQAWKKYGLPLASIPERPVNIKIDDNRRNEIVAELEESQAKTVILLGDAPIECFLSKVSDCKKKNLKDFGKNEKAYGQEHSVLINGKPYTVIPLVHVRQAGGLGKHDPTWKSLHDNWVARKGH